MPEGLSPTEVAHEIGEHREHARHDTRDRNITIIEAILLAVVALIAAYSGYASAKWSTESRLELAQANAARAEASRADLDGLTTKNFDSSTFNTWFSAYVAGNRRAMTIAVRRFRPQFRVAFDAWLKTDPENNPKAAPGPTYMPEYKQPEVVAAGQLDAKADEKYSAGATAGTNADDYVRVTVYLATVLFLVAISSHFGVRGARYALIAIGVVVMTAAVITLTTLPAPPA